MPEPPEPKFWKAWLVMSFFVAPVAWSAVALAHAPLLPTLVIALACSMIFGYFVLGRMKNDWRATATMNLEVFDRNHAVTRNIQIRK